MIEYLLTDDPLARFAREKYIFKIIPLVSIDAVNEGKGRPHITGNNLNRLWELDSSIPEIESIKQTMDDWVGKGNSIDLFLDIHGFSSRNGEWTLLMPEEAYSIPQSNKYKKLIISLLNNLPKAKPGLKSINGLSCNAGLRKYGAISLSIDGYIYDWRNRNTNLSSYYITGDKIWSFEEVKAAGKAYIEALVEYSEVFGKTSVIRKRLNIDLYQNYPNPFNNSTAISYKIPETMNVKLKIYNIAGQNVKTIIDKYVNPGMHTASWNGFDNLGRKIESGIYFVRLHAGNMKISRKIMLLK